MQSRHGKHTDRSYQRAGNRRLRPAADDQPLKPRRSGWLSWLGVVMVVVILAGLLVPNRDLIMDSLNRPLDVVRITTPLNRVSESEVTALLAAYMHKGFFDVDVTGVKARLESHPWVARAEVKRVWPNALSISLTEEIAIARWGASSLLNQSGEVFTPARLDDTSSLPLLSGPIGSEARMMENFQAFNQILYPAGLRIETLLLSDRQSWELEIVGGLRLVVGRTDVRERLKRFAGIYDKRLGNDIADIEKIDLRYNNGFAVKKRHPPLSGVAAR